MINTEVEFKESKLSTIKCISRRLIVLYSGDERGKGTAKTHRLCIYAQQYSTWPQST